MFRKYSVSLVLLGIVLVTSCQTHSNDIVLGWIGPLTGDAAAYGQSIKKGTDLAVQEVNQNGGVVGKQLQIVYEDDQATARLGTAAMQKLLSVNQPPVIIQAAASSVMLANIPIAEENKVVYISPSCSSDKIRDEKIRLNTKYIFRTWPSDSYQGKFLARFVFGKLGAKDAAIIYINNDYGAGLAQVFNDEFTKLGGKISANESFNQDATDFRAQLTKIKQANPPVVFMPSHYKEAAQLLKQAKELGIKAQFVADAALYSPELIKVAGNAADGLIVANPEWDPNSERPVVKKFVVSFAAQYHATPDVYAAAGYDLIGVLTQAIKSGATGPDQIRKALLDIRDYQGVMGTINFDDIGEVEARYTLYRIERGAFVPYS